VKQNFHNKFCIVLLMNICYLCSYTFYKTIK